MLDVFRQDFAYTRELIGIDPESSYEIAGDRPMKIGHWRRHVGILDMQPLRHPTVVVLLGGKAGARYREGDRWSERDAAPGSTQFIPAAQRIVWRIDGELDMLSVQFVPKACALGPGAGEALMADLRFAVPDPLSLGLGLAIIDELEGGAERASNGHVETLIEALCSHLEAKALRRAPLQQPSNGQQSLRRSALFEFVDQNLDRTIEIEEIARLFAVSPSYVFRFFRSEFGMTPHAYITSRRIRRACELLQTTRTQLAELADQVGFASQSHFSIVFKRHLGETPQRYRQRVMSQDGRRAAAKP